MDNQTPPDRLQPAKQDLRQITTLLGDFHDLCVAISMLSSNHLNKISSEPERSAIRAFREALKKEKAAILNGIDFEKYTQIIS